MQRAETKKPTVAAAAVGKQRTCSASSCVLTRMCVRLSTCVYGSVSRRPGNDRRSDSTNNGSRQNSSTEYEVLAAFSVVVVGPSASRFVARPALRVSRTSATISQLRVADMNAVVSHWWLSRLRNVLNTRARSLSHSSEIGVAKMSDSRTSHNANFLNIQTTFLTV